MNSEHLDRKSDSDACPAHLEQSLKDLEESRSKWVLLLGTCSSWFFVGFILPSPLSCLLLRLLQHPLCRTLVQLLQGINAGSRGLQIQPPPVSTAVRMRQLLKSPQAPNVPPSSSEPDLTSMCRPLCIREFYRLWTPPDGGEVVPASNGARQAAASPGLNNAQRRLHASYAQYLFLHRQIDALRWKVSKEWLVDLWGRCGLHFQGFKSIVIVVVVPGLVDSCCSHLSLCARALADIRRLDLRDGLGRSGEDPASALELQNFVDDCMRSQLVPGESEHCSLGRFDRSSQPLPLPQVKWNLVSSSCGTKSRRHSIDWIRITSDTVYSSTFCAFLLPSLSTSRFTNASRQLAGVKRISTPGQRQVAIVWPFQTEPEGCIAVPARVVRTRDPTRPVDWRQDAAAMALYQMARSSFPPSQKILRDRLPVSGLYSDGIRTLTMCRCAAIHFLSSGHSRNLVFA